MKTTKNVKYLKQNEVKEICTVRMINDLPCKDCKYYHAECEQICKVFNIEKPLYYKRKNKEN